MTVIGEIVRETIADTLNRDDLSDQGYDAVNRAIRHYSRTPFWFNVANTTLTLSNGSTELDLSSITDFKQETKDDGFVLYYNQIYYPLKKTGKLQYDSRNNESTGIPRYYAWVDGVLKIYPFADRDYDLQVNYFKNYPKLTQYLDTNDFTEYAEDLITERALWYLYYSIEHEPEMAAIHKQAELDELERVLDFSRQKNASGQLSTYDEVGI